MSASYDAIFNFPIYGQFEANGILGASYVTLTSLTFSFTATFRLANRKQN